MDEHMTQNETAEEIRETPQRKKTCRANKGKMIAILVLSILLAASVTLNICGLVRGRGMRMAGNNKQIEQFDGGQQGQLPGGNNGPQGQPGQMPGGGQQGQMPGGGPQGQAPGDQQNDQNADNKKSDDKTQNDQKDNKSADEQKSTM